ncbi:MAG: heavy-metal-associated domain-containing protein [Spirochaetales bacterium]|nr:heavy-metal-associated domain-containing protein [Spirochaetales bacterium]
MKTITLKVPGISCSHCEHTIKKAVSSLDGVDTIVVDLPDKTVEISFNPGKVTEDSIKKAIEDQGYDIP